MTVATCDHRGPLLRTDTCQRCGRRDEPAPVYTCALLGECTVQSYGLRMDGQRTGKRLPICIRCEKRTVDGQPAERERPQRLPRDRAIRPPLEGRPAPALQQTFATNLRRLRESRDLSIADASQAAGCSVLAWTKAESAEHWPQPSRIEAMAMALAVPAAELFAG